MIAVAAEQQGVEGIADRPIRRRRSARSTRRRSAGHVGEAIRRVAPPLRQRDRHGAGRHQQHRPGPSAAASSSRVRDDDAGGGRGVQPVRSQPCGNWRSTARRSALRRASRRGPSAAAACADRPARRVGSAASRCAPASCPSSSRHGRLPRAPSQPNIAQERDQRAHQRLARQPAHNRTSRRVLPISRHGRIGRDVAADIARPSCFLRQRQRPEIDHLAGAGADDGGAEDAALFGR